VTGAVGRPEEGLSQTLLWEGSHGEDELGAVAERVLAAVRGWQETVPDQAFCLWLTGSLGAGKTTLTGVLLRRLGLSDRVPVTSPTYTLMNDYQIAGEWYAHLDLYRSRGSAQAEELGLADARRFRGIFVEWPERAPADPYLRPTHVLAIGAVDQGTARHYRLFAVKEGH
jgi:tRNA threonylcarbamoyl adenosine modification protein YjeE